MPPPKADKSQVKRFLVQHSLPLTFGPLSACISVGFLGRRLFKQEGVADSGVAFGSQGLGSYLRQCSTCFKKGSSQANLFGWFVEEGQLVDA